MFCKNCGNNLNEGAIFCDKCGAAVGNQQQSGSCGIAPMNKKEYFASSFCTDKAKNLIKGNWIVFAVLAVYTVYLIVSSIAAVSMITNAVKSNEGGALNFFEVIEEFSGESMGLTDEDIAMFEEFETLTGMSMDSFVETIIYVVIGMIAVSALAIVLLSLLAILKKSNGCAIAALVVAVMFVSNIVIMGLSVALLVMTVLLNKEYKQYSDNYMMFGVSNVNGSNEPDFSV